MQLLAKYKNASPTVRASLWFAGCSIIQKGVSFLTVPLFTAWMSENAYGQFMLYLAWSQVIMIFATLNLHYQVYNNGAMQYKSAINRYTTSVLGLSWFVSVVVFGVLGLLSGHWSTFTGMPARWLLYMFLQSTLFMPYNLFLCRERMLNNYKSAVAITLGYIFAVTALSLFMVHGKADAAGSRIQAMVIVESLMGIGLLIHLLRRGRTLYHPEIWRYAARLAIPLIPHFLATVLLTNTDRIMIGNICGQDKVAIYSVAANLGTIMQIIVNSTNAAVNPWIYRCMESRDYGGLRRGTGLLYGIMAALTIVPTLLGTLYIRWFMKASYQAAIPMIGIIAASSFFIYLYTVFFVMELYYEKTVYTSIASVVAAALNMILNYVGITLFGYVAAAYTTLICYVFLSAAHFIFLRKTCVAKGIPVKRLVNFKLVVGFGIAVCAAAIAMPLVVGG